MKTQHPHLICHGNLEGKVPTISDEGKNYTVHLSAVTDSSIRGFYVHPNLARFFNKWGLDYLDKIYKSWN